MTQNPSPAGFLVIQSPGPLTTVQDLGRSGFLASGFSPSGAMDALSARMANLLVGNPRRSGIGNDHRRDYRWFFKALRPFPYWCRYGIYFEWASHPIVCCLRCQSGGYSMLRHSQNRMQRIPGYLRGVSITPAYGKRLYQFKMPPGRISGKKTGKGGLAALADSHCCYSRNGMAKKSTVKRESLSPASGNPRSPTPLFYCKRNQNLLPQRLPPYPSIRPNGSAAGGASHRG